MIRPVRHAGPDAGTSDSVGPEQAGVAGGVMARIAFSTVACPQWTLRQVAQAAARWGYAGVELRTFGFGSSQFACDPALTAAEKVRRVLASYGVEVACLATGLRFDEPVRPPLIGYVRAGERALRLTKWMVDLAAAIESPRVRVFAFQVRAGERWSRAVRRIADRLALAADAAYNSGVCLVLENGGSFRTADQLGEILERVASPLVGAAYSLAVAHDAGDDPIVGLRRLGARAWMVKVRDRRDDRRPCLPGEGLVPCRQTLEYLAAVAFDGWVVFEWDRAWVAELPPAEEVLPEAGRRLLGWLVPPKVPRQPGRPVG